MLLSMATIGAAEAADMPEFLRGSFGPQFSGPAYLDWSGVFFGAQAGYSNMDTDFSDATSEGVAFSLRNSTLRRRHHPEDWQILQSDLSNSGSYGVFFGYNMQWDHLVVGFDLAYNRMASMRTSASGAITRIVTNPDDTVTITAQSSMQLVDYATARARAGYAFGQFLPYGVLGIAAGRFNYSTATTVQVTGDDTLLTSITDSKDDAIAVGFVLGLGMDVALMPNVFLRGEWEFIAFAPLARIANNVNTGRVGIALKF